MDQRYGAWAQLLTLFRLIFEGGRHGSLQLPARKGYLFDPERYSCLEGRAWKRERQPGEKADVPRVSDGVIFRVLCNLLILDGERLSYRTLDVEQIGSVYESMMGFALQQATGPSIATTSKHIVFNIAELPEQKHKERSAWLHQRTDLKATGDALAK